MPSENVLAGLAPRIVEEMLQAGGLEGVEGMSPRVMGLGIELVAHQHLVTGAPPTVAELEEIVDEIWMPAIMRAATGPGDYTGSDSGYGSF